MTNENIFVVNSMYDKILIDGQVYSVDWVREAIAKHRAPSPEPGGELAEDVDSRDCEIAFNAIQHYVGSETAHLKPAEQFHVFKRVARSLESDCDEMVRDAAASVNRAEPSVAMAEYEKFVQSLPEKYPNITLVTPFPRGYAGLPPGIVPGKSYNCSQPGPEVRLPCGCWVADHDILQLCDRHSKAEQRKEHPNRPAEQP